LSQHKRRDRTLCFETLRVNDEKTKMTDVAISKACLERIQIILIKFVLNTINVYATSSVNYYHHHHHHLIRVLEPSRQWCFRSRSSIQSTPPPLYFLKIHLNIIHFSTPRHPKCSSLLWLSV
jgi:hypothetical protein